jgi:hypothetical protein
MLPQAAITAESIENFRRRAEVCRVEAEITSEPGRRQERLETALAYERMAERAKRHLANEVTRHDAPKSPLHPSHERTTQPLPASNITFLNGPPAPRP